MGTEIRERSKTGVSYEDLSDEERRAVDRLLGIFELEVDEVTIEVGSDAYRAVIESRGQLSLFGGDGRTETDDK